MRVYRIADDRHPIWDGTGAALVGGRWNSSGKSVIYGSLSYACAMLEILAHAGIGRVPRTQRFVVAEVPDELSVERHDPLTLPAGWDAEDSSVARGFGDDWLVSARSLVLVVPSVVARLEFNAIINPRHPEFQKLMVSIPEPVIWDSRLFRTIPVTD
uniref:RES domain-containing protein n=1 Tax=Aromatoleum anaerobium TaxID=182180 RepID=A0ABX1PNY9_9RHOO